MRDRDNTRKLIIPGQGRKPQPKVDRDTVVFTEDGVTVYLAIGRTDFYRNTAEFVAILAANPLLDITTADFRVRG
jgi:hypothetical protein